MTNLEKLLAGRLFSIHGQLLYRCNEHGTKDTLAILNIKHEYFCNAEINTTKTKIRFHNTFLGTIAERYMNIDEIEFIEPKN